MVNLCPWDFNPVELPGQTCSRQCYVAWLVEKLGEANEDGLVILEDGEVPPVNLTDQPWYLSEFPVKDRPKVVD